MQGRDLRELRSLFCGVVEEMEESQARTKELVARVGQLEKELAEEKEYSKDLKRDLDVALGCVDVAVECVDPDEYNEALRKAKEEGT